MTVAELVAGGQIAIEVLDIKGNPIELELMRRKC
tara:strand:- start:82889 stop:82990 length:102 start_codon:yes stop_codon:yes gene_type:complete